MAKKKEKRKYRGRPPKSLARAKDQSPYVFESFEKFVEDFRGDVTKALNREAISQACADFPDGLTPAQRIAKLFYSDSKAAVQILKHLMPQLKSMEVKGNSESPIKLIIDMSRQEDSDTEQDEDGEQD
jgi:hypothetical protein